MYKLLLNLTNVAIYMGRIYITNNILILYTNLYPPVLPKFIKRFLCYRTLYYTSPLQFVSKFIFEFPCFTVYNI